MQRGKYFDCKIKKVVRVLVSDHMSDPESAGNSIAIRNAML